MKLNNPSLFRQQCYINGQWLSADSSETMDVTNPATGDLLGRVPVTGVAETRRAIAAADNAWPIWREKTAEQRGSILRRWGELMMENQEDIAQLMTCLQSKASLWLNRGVRLLMPHPSLSGLRKRGNGSTGILFPSIRPTGGYWSSTSRLVAVPPLHPGISPLP